MDSKMGLKNIRVCLIAFILFCLQQVQGQSVSFPESFVGNWKGVLQYYKTGKDTAQTVAMELKIQAIDTTTGQYTWNLIYGKLTEDNRPYLLKPVNTAKDHWVIDELNGIILDQFWVAGRFTGAFSVQGATIVNSYWIENGELHIEFISYGTKPKATTGGNSAEIPPVDSYEVKGYQKAVLRKQ